jgi:hypothetical protein
MSEKITIASAKTAKDLAGVYAKVKTDAKGYGFTAVTALREEVVGKAMADKKKPADFVVEVDTSGKSIIAQLVCDVKGGIRSVIGRREIKSVKEFQDAVMLAKNQALAKVAKQILI